MADGIRRWRRSAILPAPGQRTYELIRPVVLFGQSPPERRRDGRGWLNAPFTPRSPALLYDQASLGLIAT
jgi:hypothetical protein